jgi:hypothetical protein
MVHAHVVLPAFVHSRRLLARGGRLSATFDRPRPDCDSETPGKGGIPHRSPRRKAWRALLALCGLELEEAAYLNY